MPRSKAHNLLLTFLGNYRAGDIFSEAQLLSHMHWSTITLKTYESKHMLAPFISRVDTNTFRALKDGLKVTPQQIIDSFSQSRPDSLTLTKGLSFSGQNDTYILKKKIGEGAVGHVWEASSDSRSGEEVAVKVMLPRQDLLDPSKLENVRERFRRESRNGKQLDHQNLIHYVDYGTYADHPFLVMELAKYSVQQYLDKNPPFSVEDSVTMIKGCIEALSYLHERKCKHRDVKPANILRVNRGYVLGDLGIVLWSDLSPAFTGAGTVTRASVQLGSWFYMAPEQLQNPHQVDYKSDVYALGVTWYQLLTNRTPSPQEIAAKRYPEACSESVINDLITKMLLYDLDDRAELSYISKKIKTF